MSQEIIDKLNEAGLKEVARKSLRENDYNDVIEYWDGKIWRVFAK